MKQAGDDRTKARYRIKRYAPAAGQPEKIGKTSGQRAGQGLDDCGLRKIIGHALKQAAPLKLYAVGGYGKRVGHALKHVGHHVAHVFSHVRGFGPVVAQGGDHAVRGLARVAQLQFGLPLRHPHHVQPGRFIGPGPLMNGVNLRGFGRAHDFQKFFFKFRAQLLVCLARADLPHSLRLQGLDLIQGVWRVHACGHGRIQALKLLAHALDLLFRFGQADFVNGLANIPDMRGHGVRAGVVGVKGYLLQPRPFGQGRGRGAQVFAQPGKLALILITGVFLLRHGQLGQLVIQAGQGCGQAFGAAARLVVHRSQPLLQIDSLVIFGGLLRG